VGTVCCGIEASGTVPGNRWGRDRGQAVLAPEVTTWSDIPWPEVEARVHALQRRIYRAEQEGNRRKVHSLQRLLLRSTSAKLLAVRRVTQDNQGKKTPGVDGIVFLDPEERLAVAFNLNLEQKPLPLRRIWIAKPGTEEKRPLGIPTMRDRCVQALVKEALEPQWEARFEPNSYGFRPGRSGHDAIESIFQNICRKSKYALDADIRKCFDNIEHQPLLDKIDTIPILRRIIKKWLKAGVMDNLELSRPEKGTPQGGVISPLLANIALHGMEEVVHEVKKGKGGPQLIRYADDFVILHEERTVIEKCQEAVRQFLAKIGLELKPEKTKITHTLKTDEGAPGFDFLGYTVRQFRVGKHQCRKSQQGNPLGFKTLIKPSKHKVKKHLDNLGQVIHTLQATSQEELIGVLNPKIQGWTLYYRNSVAKKTYSRLDNQMYHKLRRWASRRHPQKGSGWRTKRYWRSQGNANWVFGTDKTSLLRHDRMKIIRHVKVRGQKSPFDGDWLYWSSRTGSYPGVELVTGWLLKRQAGRCAECGHYFLPGQDLMERHHKDENRKNNKRSNLELVHRHCHDALHATKDENQPAEFP
jgi:RNA-directed DNA polymerase